MRTPTVYGALAIPLTRVAAGGTVRLELRCVGARAGDGIEVRITKGAEGCSVDAVVLRQDLIEINIHNTGSENTIISPGSASVVCRKPVQFDFF